MGRSNQAGHTVKGHVSSFHKQIYQKALSAPDVATAIGTNIDELLRHVLIFARTARMLYKIFDEIQKTCEKLRILQKITSCIKITRERLANVSSFKDTKGEAKGEDAEIRVIELCSECDIREKPEEMAERGWLILSPLPDLNSDDKNNAESGDNSSLHRYHHNERNKAVVARGKFLHDLILHATRLLEGRGRQIMPIVLAYRPNSNSQSIFESNLSGVSTY